MPKRRPVVASILIPLMVGLVALSTVLQRPRFASVHTVDIVQLLGAGLCFGVALSSFAFWLRTRGTP